MKPTNRTWLLFWKSQIFFIYLSKANIHNCQSHEQVKTPIFPFAGTVGTILHGTFCVNAIFFSTPSISPTD